MATSPLPPPPLPPPPPPPSPSFVFSGNGYSDHKDWRYPLPQYTERRRSNDLNSKIMLVSIISLSAVVVLVAALHVYARWILRRQARRRAAMRGLGLAAAGANGRLHQPPPKAGLDPSIIASLPTFVFHQQPDPQAQTDQKALTVNPECAVCLSVLEEEDVVRLLVNCKHTFHVECIDRWLASHSTCPICRAEAQPKAQPPEPSEPSIEVEGTSSSSEPSVEIESTQPAHKRSGSVSRLSSFRRILSRERSLRRIQPAEQDSTEDIERQ